MDASTTRSPAQLFALVVGVVYLMVGLVGFAVTGLDNFADAKGDNALLGLDLNPLHNIVHIGLGAAWLYGALTHASARMINLVLGVVLVLVAVLGFADVIVHDLIAANVADDGLHLVTGIASIIFGTAAATRKVAA
jgi:Domain of unknown function (DUF4383)